MSGAWKEFHLAGQSVAPGRRRVLPLETRTTTGSVRLTPVAIVHGRRPGPMLTLVSGLHGNELNGIEALCRVVETLDPDALHGTVAALPAAYGPALEARVFFPGQPPNEPKVQGHPNNIQQRWPGDPDGNDADRIAHTIFREVIGKGQALIDLHSWSKLSASAALAPSDDAKAVALAHAFGLPCVNLLGSGRMQGSRGTARAAAAAAGLAAITVELSGQWEIFEESVQEAIRGVRSALRHLGMLPDEPAPPTRVFDAGAEHRVPSPVTGLFMPAVRAGSVVRKGDRIGAVRNVQTLERIEVHAPMDGVLSTLLVREGSDVSLHKMHALVDQGECLATLRSVVT